MMNLLIVGALAVAASAQAVVTPKGPDQASPYARLFVPAPLDSVPVETTAPRPARVVESGRRSGTVERGACNMPVIRGNADVDPRMIVPLPADNGAKIRAIEPPTCWEPAK